jgi:hypothetical protein
MIRVPQPSSLKSKSPRFGIKDANYCSMQIYDDKDLMVKMGKLVQTKTAFFGMNYLKKWLNK